VATLAASLAAFFRARHTELAVEGAHEARVESVMR
jgi:hypothetical protein